MAIQVNGTTVIDNSRALTNISSVDSSVVTAMGNAGVGGATSLITDWTNIPSGNTWSLTLSSSYDLIRIYINRMNVNNTNQIDHSFRLQYSGGTETGYDYVQSYDQGNGGSRQTVDAVQFGSGYGTGDSTPDYTSAQIDISFHGDSSRRTQYRAMGISEDGNDRFIRITNGLLARNRAHTSLLFFNNWPASYNSGQYLMIGVTL